MLTLQQINAASAAEFVALLDGTYEHSPWVAQRALKSRPFQSLPQLKHGLVTALSQASLDEKLRLIRAHPELAGLRILQRGNRLSITPVEADEWDFILTLIGKA